MSPNDVWAVGEINRRSVIEHGDGSSWTAVNHPRPKRPRGNTLLSVSADSTGDAWTVGFTGQGAGAITLRWDGTSWVTSS